MAKKISGDTEHEGETLNIGARDQWSSYTIDLHEVLAKKAQTTDVVFLGDINARIGRASNSDEEKFIGKYGEENQKRNLGGSLAIDFFRECSLTSLNARQPSTHVPFTFHSRAKGHSLIDIIACSTSMYRREYVATPIDDATLTGKEDHLPVVVTLRLKRRAQKPKKRVPREVWNWRSWIRIKRQTCFLMYATRL